MYHLSTWNFRVFQMGYPLLQAHHFYLVMKETIYGVGSTCLSDDIAFNLIDERHIPHVQELP